MLNSNTEILKGLQYFYSYTSFLGSSYFLGLMMNLDVLRIENRIDNKVQSAKLQPHLGPIRKTSRSNNIIQSLIQLVASPIAY
jgi:hypothetical protein